MANIKDVFRVARRDARLQTIINSHLQGIGHPQHLVSGYSFNLKDEVSPAFCLGVQIFNLPVGFVFVSDDFSKILKDDELEFVVLHEMGHIMKNHFVSSAFVWLMKSWIVDIIADIFEVSKKKAVEYLEWGKALYVLFSQKRTIEEEAKARVELEADQYAVMSQNKKEPAISTLLKLSNGNIRMPSHVTVDGRFPFPVTTYKERIEAIKKCSFDYYLPLYVP